MGRERKQEKMKYVLSPSELSNLNPEEFVCIRHFGRLVGIIAMAIELEKREITF